MHKHTARRAWMDGTYRVDEQRHKLPTKQSALLLDESYGPAHGVVIVKIERSFFRNIKQEIRKMSFFFVTRFSKY